MATPDRFRDPRRSAGRAALDGYNVGTTTSAGWQSFEQVFCVDHAGARPMAARPEIGARAFVWFNHAKEAGWRIQSSDASRIAFANAVAAPRYRG